MRQGDALFCDALDGLRRGDFTRLEPLFDAREAVGSHIVQWHAEGRFDREPAALAEALTCACFLGCGAVADYLLAQGVDPAAGTATGMNALHWAANRGQLETVRLLLRANAPLEARSMYGGTVLSTAVWSAINEPRRAHPHIIEALLDAGARADAVDYPTGDERIDVIFRRHAAHASDLDAADQ